MSTSFLSHHRRLAAFLAALTILLRLSLWTAVQGSNRMLGPLMGPTTDSLAYVHLAQGLRHGCGFVLMENGKCASPPTSAEVKVAEWIDNDIFPEITRTPGYPFFLSLFSDLRDALVAQALLSGLMVFVVYLFVAARWSASAALISSALIAFDVPSIVFANEAMTETMFTVLYVLGVISALCAASARYDTRQKFALALMSSTLLACSIMVRPIGQFAVLVPALIPLAYAGASLLKKFGFVMLTLSIPVVMIAGWSLRNYQVSGVAYFSPIGAVNLYYYHAVGTLTYAEHSESEVTMRPDKSSLTKQALTIIVHHPVAFARLTAWSFVYLCVVPERSGFKNALGIRRTFLLEAPGSLRALATLSALRKSPREALQSVYRSEFDSSPVVISVVVFQIVLGLILWLGVILALRFVGFRSYENWCATFCAATALTVLLPACDLVAAARFRIPAIPFLAILAGIGLAHAMHGSRRGEAAR